MGRVIIAGSMNMDVVAFGERLPLPGETLIGSGLGFFAGGKGLNPAVAAARQNADTHILARLGQDAFGDRLLEFARDAGIDVGHVRREAIEPTGTALILVAESGENSIVVVPGANGQLSIRDVEDLEIEREDVLVSLFEIPMDTCRAFLEAGKRKGARTVLSPSPAKDCPFLDLPDFIVLNQTELEFYASESGSAPVEQAARSLLRREGQSAIVTLGSNGAMAVTRESTFVAEGRSVEAVDTTGAGDCFTGSFAARLAAGDAIEAAMRYANVAASICVTRAGAAPSMPSREEVEAALGA